jgi:hypothetical protein
MQTSRDRQHEVRIAINEKSATIKPNVQSSYPKDATRWGTNA